MKNIRSFLRQYEPFFVLIILFILVLTFIYYLNDNRILYNRYVQLHQIIGQNKNRLDRDCKNIQSMLGDPLYKAFKKSKINVVLKQKNFTKHIYTLNAKNKWVHIDEIISLPLEKYEQFQGILKAQYRLRMTLNKHQNLFLFMRQLKHDLACIFQLDQVTISPISGENNLSAIVHLTCLLRGDE